MLINLEEAGDLGTRQDDVLLLGKCDDIVRELARELGWLDELKSAWKETRNSLDNPPPTDEESEEESEGQTAKAEETADERLQRDIAWLTQSVDVTLRVSDDLKKRVEKETKDEAVKRVEKETKGEPVKKQVGKETKEKN